MEEKVANISIHKPSRQSPIAMFLIVQNLLRQLVQQFWPILLVLILNYFNFQAKSQSSTYDSPYITYIIFILGGLSTIGSIIAYFKFYYYIKEDEFIIEKGLFKKSKISIPFSRIQTINFEQNLIHQAFNVVRLEIDSAGSNQKEISLQAIRREQAEAIRAYIMTEKAKLSASTLTDTSATQTLPAEKTHLLLTLNPLDLLKVGISQNHLRGLGVILGFGFWVFQSLEDFIPDFRPGENPVDYIKEDLGLGTIFTFWVYLIFVLVLFSILISLVLTVFRHYDLQFIRTKAGFKVISGLFTKREASANIHKIQLIRWEDSLLKRMFGIFRLHLFQASSSIVSERQSISVPGCYNTQIDKVRSTYFPNEVLYPYTTHSISSLIIGRRLLYIGGIPALFLMVWAYLNQSLFDAIWAILWLVFILIMSYYHHKHWRFHISREGILTEHGIFGTEFTLLKWYKIQAINARQSLYQRRKKIMDLHFYTAAGVVKIPYVPLKQAQEITNYVLYKVETDRRDWM